MAAQACLLLLHRETPCYERLHSIHVYPGRDFALSSAAAAAGECWEHGVVLLAWDAVRGGAANPFDGNNVVLHEFAHLLDYEDGQPDGTPLLDRGAAPAEEAGRYTAWARMLSKEYEEFQLSIEKDDKPVLNSYGLGDPAEFFAVATECFFEKPRQLQKRHPELYAALKLFYKQDPAAWTADSQAPEPPAGVASPLNNSNVADGGSRGWA